MEMQIAVLIVADDPLTRVGLAALLADVDDVNVVGQVTSHHLDAALETYDPDVLLWDVDWQEAVELQDFPPVIALVADDDVVSFAWQAGVAAVLPRSAEPEQIAVASNAALQDLVIIAPEFVELLDSHSTLSSVLPEPLSSRELEVLNLIAEGHSNKTIAERLFISQNTVKFHLNAILQKLDAQNRTEAAVKAARLGVINL